MKPKVDTQHEGEMHDMKSKLEKQQADRLKRQQEERDQDRNEKEILDRKIQKRKEEYEIRKADRGMRSRGGGLSDHSYSPGKH